MTAFFALLVIALVAYLWGSIPTGYWMGKLIRGKDFDLRSYGSGRTGATNVLRTLGVVPAIITFLVDLSKGVGPALLASLIPWFQVDGWGLFVAGLAALLGHVYPIFSNFKGGRGVLTGGGVLLVADYRIFLISFIVVILTIVITRYVSLGSVLGGLVALICSLVFYFLNWISLPVSVTLIVLPLLIIVFHRDNIGRLLSGTESKIGQKARPAAEHGKAQE